MEWVETTGKTVHEAREAALDILGVHEDEAEFEVLAEARTGLLGRLKEEARVRARVQPAAPRAKNERSRRRRGGNPRQDQNEPKGARRKQNDGASSDSNNEGRTKRKKGSGASSGRQGQNQDQQVKKTTGSRQETMTNEATMPLTEQAVLAEQFVVGLAEKFGSTVTFNHEQVDDEEIRITVSGENIGRMVGHRGATAMAIDDLVRTVLQRQAGSSRNGRIRVDVGGVRARRAEALAKFAHAQAQRVAETGTPCSLEPMNSSDRKLIHDTLAEVASVETKSAGEDPNRRVVIVPAGDAA